MVVLQLLDCGSVLAGSKPGHTGALCKYSQCGVDEEEWTMLQVPKNQLMILQQQKTVSGSRAL